MAGATRLSALGAGPRAGAGGAGGEPVFYYQPGFRYIRFFEHLLFGDGDLLVAATAFALLLFAVVSTMRRLHRPRRASWIVCGIAGALMLVVCTAQTGAVSFVVDGASEYPTWIATLLALPAMWVSTTRRRWIAGAGALGVAAVTRLAALHDAAARAELRSQLVYVFAFTPLRWDLAPLWFALHALQAHILAGHLLMGAVAALCARLPAARSVGHN